MSLLGRRMDLDGQTLSVDLAYDTVLAPGGDLFTAVKSSIGTVSLREFANARGEGDLRATLPVAGDAVSLFRTDDGLGSVVRRPGADAFATSVLIHSAIDPADPTFPVDTQIASGRLSDPKAVATGDGFAVIYENAALGRGDEIVQFHTADGGLIDTVNLGAQFASDLLEIRNDRVVVFGEDSTGAYFRRFDGDGDEIGSRSALPEIGASAAVNGGGFLHASGGANGVILLQSYGANGNASGKPLRIATETPTSPAYDDGALAVTQTQAGLIALAYTADRIEDDGFSTSSEVYLTLLTKNGDVVDGPVRFDSGGFGDTGRPDFLSLQKGLTLFSYADQGFPRSIEGQVITAPDTLQFGGGKNQKMNGAAGQDILSGLAGNDTLSGEAGDDTLFGGSGSDRALGGAGADRLDGGGSADRLLGQNGADLLLGGLGGDTLVGGKGNDTLFGGGGNDLEQGGGGKDTFWASSGGDTLVGGPGSDTFVYAKSGFGRDVIDGIQRIDVLDFSAFSASRIDVFENRQGVVVELNTSNRILLPDANLNAVEDALIFG